MGCIGLLAVLTASCLPARDTATLSSLRQLDEYPLYVMNYYGSYAGDLSFHQPPTPANVTSFLPPGYPEFSPNWGCSLFSASGDAQNELYGRNFDWQYSPALVLFTDPPGGYRSVSLVDLAYLLGADGSKNLGRLPLAERERLLRAPFWPFDGMNEHGLAIGMAAVPQESRVFKPGKPTLDSLAIIRQVLDNARNVEEAITIMGQYNLDFGGGPPLHYLIADRSGNSALVEFTDEMVILKNTNPWHLATNHLRLDLAPEEPAGCWRYARIEQALARSGGKLSQQAAMDLLASVAQGGDNPTQWSVVYQLSTGKIHIAMGGNYLKTYTLQLK
jgi:choloylglycine hydrolase